MKGTTMRTVIAALLLSLIPALANAGCPPREVALGQLENMQGEQMTALGLSTDGRSVIEFYANDAKGTWTLLETYPDGTACRRASGDGWMRLAPQGPAI